VKKFDDMWNEIHRLKNISNEYTPIIDNAMKEMHARMRQIELKGIIIEEQLAKLKG